MTPAIPRWESKDGEEFNHTGSQKSDWIGFEYAESVWTALEKSIEVTPRKSLFERIKSWWVRFVLKIN